MTQGEMAAQLRTIAARGNCSVYQAAVNNPQLAGGLEVLAQEEARAGRPRGSGSSSPMELRPSGLKPHRGLEF